MHKQKLAEAKKQTEIIENKKFFHDSHVRALQEKRWTSDAAVNNRLFVDVFLLACHSLMAYLMPDKETIVSNVEARRNKLRTLLQMEADYYEVLSHIIEIILQYALNLSPRTRDRAYSCLKDRIGDILNKGDNPKDNVFRSKFIKLF